MGGREGEPAKLEYSTVIDAATFATSYNAFWHANTPTCEHFVRRLNMDGLERFEPPMAKSSTSNRAVIAEFSFSLFVERKRNDLAGGERRPDDAIEEAAWLMAKMRLAPYVNQGLTLDRKFDEDERREVVEILRSLVRFFTDPNRRLVLRPTFSGCGFVDASEGDVIFGETIYEIKTVDRPFRGSDIRQTITYAALNFAAGQFDIGNIGLINPRRGQFCDIDLDYVCSEISGRPAQELLATIIQAISSGGISR